MITRSIIKKLHKAIKEAQPQATIDALTDILAENITEASEEPVFYSIPFDQISNIIKKVEFLNLTKVMDPFALLQTLFQKTSEAYPNEAVSLLNIIEVDNLPPFIPNDIIPIISKFTNCELLTKLGELYENDKCLLTPDYEGEIRELKEENTQLKHANEELRKRIKEFEEQIKNLREKESKVEPVLKKPNDFEESVFDAIEKGKIDSVRYHFEVLHADKGATCERQIPGDNSTTKGLTYLHLASAHGHLPIVQYLCEVAKVNTKATDVDDETVLHIACFTGHLPVIRYLCEVAKVNPEARDKGGNTPLHYAGYTNNLPIVKYLCEVVKVNPDPSNNKGHTPLHFACLRGHLQLVRYYCEVQKVNTTGAYSWAKREEVRKYLESIGVHK